jgi:D-ribulokinase
MAKVQDPLFLSVDVGTGSVRAALFATTGAKLGPAQVHPIKTRSPAPSCYEQSTADIWSALCTAARACIAASGRPAFDVTAIGIDATCSLVAVNSATGEPVAVSTDPNFDVVLWMDHRAIIETDIINALDHPSVAAVRSRCGGRLSPEQEPGKLAHLKSHMDPSRWAQASFFDLSDWVAFKCVRPLSPADMPRSSCTVACKWGWDGEWDAEFWAAIGLGELAADGFARIGSHIIAPGGCVGSLSRDAAVELGLDPSTDISVAVPMIDAHSGAVALIDSSSPSLDRHAPHLENRLAMVCGTSTCHIAVTKGHGISVNGVWGGFRDAVYSGYFTSEGGQSATGSLLDYIIDQSSVAFQLRRRADARDISIYQLLEEIASDANDGNREASVHILPYCMLRVAVCSIADPDKAFTVSHVLTTIVLVWIFLTVLGNRSPRADPTLLGAIAGLKLTPPGSAEAERELAGKMVPCPCIF